MHTSVHAYMKSTKRGIFLQETPKKDQSGSNHFWIPISNVSVTPYYEKNFKLKPKTHIKKTQSINRRNYIQEYNEVIEKL